jgi:hypothetical protein
VSHYYPLRPKPAVTLENSWHGASLTNSTDMGGSMRMDNIQDGLFFIQPVAVAERSEAWTVFDHSEAVIEGSNPALGMDV